MLERNILESPSPIKDRFDFLVRAGRDFFAQSGLIDPTRILTYADIRSIEDFHRYTAPDAPHNLWRLHETSQIIHPHIVDASTFDNWSKSGGPLEHIRLATLAADIITRKLQEHIRPITEETPGIIADHIQDLQVVSPLQTAVTAALHDEGRQITHILGTNEEFEKLLFSQIGIREDIIAAIPDLELMRVPMEHSMEQEVFDHSTVALIVRLADEFGKRRPHTATTYTASDYNVSDRTSWTNRYRNKPSSGLSSDIIMRNNLDLHVANVPRYFQALDTWVQKVSTYTLSSLVEELQSDLENVLMKQKREEMRPYWNVNSIAMTRGGEHNEGHSLREYAKMLGFTFDELKGKHILDLGSGPGAAFESDVRKRKLTRHVVSVSPDYVFSRHRRKLKKFNPAVTGVSATGDRLPFAPNTFDTVVSLHLFEHITVEDFVEIVYEAMRVLKPGGSFYIGPTNMELDENMEAHFPFLEILKTRPDLKKLFSERATYRVYRVPMSIFSAQIFDPLTGSPIGQQPGFSIIIEKNNAYQSG